MSNSSEFVVCHGMAIMVGSRAIGRGKALPNNVASEVLATLLETGVIMHRDSWIEHNKPKAAPVSKKSSQEVPKAAEAWDATDPVHLLQSGPRDISHLGESASGESALARAKRAAQG